jgi:hypothetical protein
LSGTEKSLFNRFETLFRAHIDRRVSDASVTSSAACRIEAREELVFEEWGADPTERRSRWANDPSRRWRTSARCCASA